MRIAGLVPLSLCDYPGHIAAVVFTQGCNFSCPYCHNKHLIPESSQGAEMLEESSIFSLLAERCAKLQGVVVSGGEPTLQPDLASFLRRVKALGLKTKLDTNGARPVVLSDLLGENLLDFVAMDIKAPWRKYNALAGVVCDVAKLQQSVDLIAGAGIDHQFRTTQAHHLLSEEDYAEVKCQIPAGSPHVWQEYRDG
ncbi:MAG: anaerobic ribonucleoside-triphosphate reductase activating protein [Kiritimatiellae bacterium]|nr:anaerobic ribonucleoside-triphosphate reductase activating protein [Kiritimatiellia bacterium]